MTLVNRLHPSDLDRIHIQRMDHATASLVRELSSIGDPVVDYVLRRWSVALFDESIGLEYPATAKQILAKELYNYKVAKQKKKPAKRK